MKKKIIIPVVILALAGTGVFIWKRSTSKQGRNSPSTQVVEATRATLEDFVEATGTVQPLNRVEVKPPIAGRVEKLLVDEGDRVGAGTILAWMSSSDRAAILDAARAQGPEEVKKWEDSYKATPIVAPLSGSIILRNVVVGQTVDAATALFAMSDRLVVLADVDESSIGRVRAGMPAVITLDSYPDQPINGKVFQILHEGKNVSNVITYGAKIQPNKVPAFFRSQMTANIRLVVTKKDDVIVLPDEAVRTTPSGDREVQIPGPDGKLVTKSVQVGLESGDQVEIVSGLAEGDKVLVTRRRYRPQQAQSRSPLVMGGNRNQQQTQGTGTRSGDSGNRRGNSSN